MEKYLDYASGNNIDAAPLPLYIYPDRPVSFDDVMSAMGDHYENTPFDMTNDPGAGPYLSPYRPRPLAWKYNEQTYFNERPVGTQQSSFSFISQMRSSLPNPIGGILCLPTMMPTLHHTLLFIVVSEKFRHATLLNMEML